MNGVNEGCEKRLEFSHVQPASMSSFKVCSIQLPFGFDAMILEVARDFSLCVVLFTFLDCCLCSSTEISKLIC